MELLTKMDQQILSKAASEALNAFLRRLLDRNAYSHLYAYKAFNGAPVAFIGPHWEDVDFTKTYCHIAVVEKTRDGKPLNKGYVGFNESIEYEDYPYYTAKGDDWNQVKYYLALIHKECNAKNPDSVVIDDLFLLLDKLLVDLSYKYEIVSDL